MLRQDAEEADSLKKARACDKRNAEIEAAVKELFIEAHLVDLSRNGDAFFVDHAVLSEVLHHLLEALVKIGVEEEGAYHVSSESFALDSNNR